MKQNCTNQNRLWVPFVTMVFLAMSLITILSCQKQVNEYQNKVGEPKLEKLFPLSTIADSDIRALATEAKRQNDQLNFAAEFLKRNGVILWNNAKKAISSGGLHAVIPFVLEGKQETNGFLISQKSNEGKSSFVVYRKDRLVNYGFSDNASNLNAFQVQSLLNYFNATLFGKNSFSLVDGRQIPVKIRQRRPGNIELSNLKPIFKIQEHGSNARTTGICFSYTTETEWWYCPNGDGGNGDCAGGTYDHSTYETHTFCFDSANPYNQDAADWSGGGGGGGGGDNYPLYAIISNQLNNILAPGDSYYINSQLDPSQSLSFQSVGEFQNYLSTNAANQSADLTEPATIIDLENKIEHGKFNLTFLGGVDISTKVEKVGNVWNLNEVTSTEYGITLGWSWEQSAFSQSTLSNEITVVVEGYVKYNIIIESLGTAYKQFYKFQMKIDKTTGKITSLSKL